MLTDEWGKNVIVDLGGSSSLQEPDEESDSDVVPVWHEVENETQESLEEVEGGEHHPVGEPYFVVLLVLGLDRSDAVDRGENDRVGRYEDCPSLEKHYNDCKQAKCERHH